MKVSELKKGMLLKCASPKQTIRSSSYPYAADDGEVEWANVVPKRRSAWHSKNFPADESDIVMYIGTKQDVNVKATWSNKFILLNGKIAAVDPAAWRKLVPVDESR